MNRFLLPFLLVALGVRVFGAMPAKPEAKPKLPPEAEQLRLTCQQTVDHLLDPMRERYVADLKRLLDQYTRAGKLDESLAIKNEMDSAAAGSTSADKLPDDAQRLKDALKQDSERMVKPVRERYISDLQRVLDQTTRAGKLEAAVAVKAELDAAIAGTSSAVDMAGEFEHKLYGVTWTWNGAWHFKFEADGSHPGIGFAEWKIVRPYTIEYKFGDGNHGTIVFEKSMQGGVINEINPQGKKNPMTLYRLKE